MHRFIIFISFTFLSTTSVFCYSPLFKQLIESDEKIDSISHTIIKKRVYSYFIVGLNEHLGTYTTEDILTFSGELVKKRLIKENVPSSDITRPHKIWSKIISYKFGNVSSIHLSKYISDSYAIRTDKTYVADDNGIMRKLKDVKKDHSPHGYEKPNKFKIFVHQRKSIN